MHKRALLPLIVNVGQGIAPSTPTRSVQPVTKVLVRVGGSAGRMHPSQQPRGQRERIKNVTIGLSTKPAGARVMNSPVSKVSYFQ
jgi:hypothetical protein